MALSKKIASLLLLLVALTAALEAMPRTLVASLAIPGTASAPLNRGPYGTSVLVSLMERLGYNVLVVSSLRELDERGIWGSMDVAYVLVAPYNNDTGDYVEYVTGAVRDHVADGRKFYFLLADEAPIGDAAALFEEAHQLICPGVPVAGMGGILPLDSVLVRVYSGDSWVDVASGYTSYIDTPLMPVDYLVRTYGSLAPEPVVRGLAGGVRVSIEGWAWPSTSPLMPLLWYPIFYTCSSPYGTIGLLADSTLLINAVLASNETYLEAASFIVSGVIGPPREDLIVVFDQRMYIDEDLALSFAIRFHPSRVLIEGEKIYSSVEQRGVSLLRSDPLLTTAVALALALGIWGLLPAWTRGASRIKGSRVKRRRGKAKMQAPLSGYCDVLAEWLQAHGTSIDDLASGYIGALKTTASTKELSSLAKSVKRLCLLRRLAGSQLFARTPLRKLVVDAEEKAFKILVLTGWNPAEQV